MARFAGSVAATTGRRQEPQVPWSRDRYIGQGRCLVLVSSALWLGLERRDLARVEAGKAQIEVQTPQIEEFLGQKLVIPLSPGNRAVHHEPKGFNLRVAPFVAQQHRDVTEAEFARGFQPQMAVHNLAAGARQHRDFEAELLYRRAHAVNGRIVLARVARVQHEPINGPYFNLHGSTPGKSSKPAAFHTRAGYGAAAPRLWEG